MAMLQFERTRISRPVMREVSLASFLRGLLSRATPSHLKPWYSLNEQLLRDIGKSVVDAEIAKLQAHGVSEISHICDQANRYRLDRPL
jgi:hypothetical protein